MKFTSSCFAFVLVTANVLGQGVDYSDRELHYSIKLPKGWYKLPPDVMRVATQNLAQLTGTTPPIYQAWFQRIDKPPGSYPYFQISNQICDMPTMSELEVGVEKIVKKTSDTTLEKELVRKGVVSNIRMLNPAVDPRRTMASYEIEQTINLDNTGKVRGKMCIFPGKLGVAQLVFYASADEYLHNTRDIEFVLDSFAFDSGFDYQSGLRVGASPGGFDSSRLWFFGIVGGILAPLLYRLLKSRRPSSSSWLLHVRVFCVLIFIIAVLEILLYPPTGDIVLFLNVGAITLAVGVFAATYVIQASANSAAGSVNSIAIAPASQDGDI